MRWNYLTQELHLNAIVYVASSFKLTAGSLAVKHRRSFAHRNYLRCNRPRSIYQYSNMGPRLSGLTSIFGVFLLWELRDKRNLKNLQF